MQKIKIEGEDFFKLVINGTIVIQDIQNFVDGYIILAKKDNKEIRFLMKEVELYEIIFNETTWSIK